LDYISLNVAPDGGMKLPGMLAITLLKPRSSSADLLLLKEVCGFGPIRKRKAADRRKHGLRYILLVDRGAQPAFSFSMAQSKAAWQPPLILAFGLALTASLLFAAESPELRSVQAKALYEKALRYSEKSDWNGAVLELNRALRHEPANLQLLLELGIAYGELKEFRQAIRAHTKAVQVAPRSARAHYNLGVTLDRSKPGKGLGSEEYRKALQLNPKDVNSLVNLAVNLGDQESAEARRLLQRALQLDSKNPEAHFNLGLLQRNAREHPMATASFQRAIELNPKALEPRRQLVSILVLEERWDEASKQCEHILSQAPEDSDIRYTYGQTLIRKGLTAEGREELQKSQTSRQKRQHLEEIDKLVSQAVSSLSKGDMQNSLDRLNEALAKDANHAPAHMYRGLALASRGDLPQAIEALSKAVHLEPGSARSHHNLGAVLLQAGRLDAALQEFEIALKLDPYSPEAHNNIGLVLSEKQKTEEAIEHFESAAELKPEYVEAIFNLGLALRSSHRIDEALRAFRKAARLAPGNPQVQLAMGMALKDKGDLKGSQEALARAKALQKIPPSHPGTPQ
jgi:tetratricopeptide (TPR) repeat protein